VVDDAGLDEAGELVVVFVAFVLDAEDALFFGVALDETVDVALADPVDADALDVAEVSDVAEFVELVHVASGLGRALFLGGSAELALGLGLGDFVGVAVEEGLSLGLALPLGLLLVLTEAEGLELGVLPVLSLALDDVDVAGAVAVVDALLEALVLVSVSDGRVDGDEHAACVVCGATPGNVGTVSSAAEGFGAVDWPAGVPAAGEGLLFVKACVMSFPTFMSPWRAGGTTARSTPTANTAAPTAKAGRSIASRQSLGRCGAFRCADSGRPSRFGARRRPSPARNPEMATQAPSTPLGRLARAGRDRIFSRIRSRPSAPGST
jgi:hypothetical protein